MSVEEQISRIISSELNPKDFKVINESHLHAGHAGDDGSGESHFRLEIVSERFAGLSRVECHRMVFDLLEKGLETMPHAISIRATEP